MTRQYNSTRTVNEFSDSELLATFMRSKDGVSAIERARLALAKAGSLRSMFSGDGVNEKAMYYLTATQALKINAGMELGRRVAFETVMQGDVLSSPEHVRRLLGLRLTHQENEVFGMICLDNRHRVIEMMDMFTGTIDSATVHPRVILQACLRNNSAALIIYHQHPSGVVEPSDSDVRLTRKLVDACSLVEIRILDHIIIGQGVYTSLAERGLM